MVRFESSWAEVFMRQRKEFSEAAGLGFEPRLTDPLESVSTPSPLFTAVQKPTFLSQISGSRVSGCSPLFLRVTVKSLSKSSRPENRFTRFGSRSRNEQGATSDLQVVDFPLPIVLSLRRTGPQIDWRYPRLYGNALVACTERTRTALKRACRIAPAYR
jgi:hypothetical protein